LSITSQTTLTHITPTICVCVCVDGFIVTLNLHLHSESRFKAAFPEKVGIC